MQPAHCGGFCYSGLVFLRQMVAIYRAKIAPVTHHLDSKSDSCPRRIVRDDPVRVVQSGDARSPGRAEKFPMRKLLRYATMPTRGET